MHFVQYMYMTFLCCRDSLRMNGIAEKAVFEYI